MELKVDKLTKTYGKKVALNSFSYDFKEGIYGILGPNGSGKSTLMNLITDNIKREKGNIFYNNNEILELGSSYRSFLGYMPQQQGLYDEFSGRKFLYYMANLKGLSKQETKSQVEKLLDIVGLSGDAHRKAGGYSGGMKQRLLLAQALLGDPQILILDEPTAGLDPKERIRIRNYISSISKNKIVLLSTHVVQDVESISKEIILLKDGEILKSGSPNTLISSIKGTVFEKKCTSEEIEIYQNKYSLGNIYLRDDGEYLRMLGDIKPEGFEVVDFSLGLEDVYLYYFESIYEQH